MTTQLPIVVIGGGTAGCTVVSTLAAITTRTIVLIEPGPSSVHDDEAAFFTVLSDDSLSREVQTTLVDGGLDTPYVQAHVLGGGSAINGLLLTGDEPRISSAYPVAFGNVSMYSKNTSARKITWSPSCAMSDVAMRPFG